MDVHKWTDKYTLNITLDYLIKNLCLNQNCTSFAACVHLRTIERVKMTSIFI
jgi:hypothetical protein